MQIDPSNFSERFDVESLLIKQVELGKDEYIEDLFNYWKIDNQLDKISDYLIKFIAQFELNKNMDKLKDCLIKLISINPSKIDYVYKLTKIFYYEKNFFQFEKYAIIGIENHCENCTIVLAYYYYKESCFKLMDECLLTGISRQSYKCMYKYAYTLLIREKYDLMETYLLQAIDLGGENFFQKILNYYFNENTNYNVIKIYCEIGIRCKKFVFCMFILGYYYYQIEKNYDQMEKYCIMGAENDCIKSIYTLGNYYQFVKKDFQLMKHYYLMGIERNCPKCMNNFAIYYHINSDYQSMKYYYQMSIELGYNKAMHNLANYYYNIEKDFINALKYYLKAVQYGFNKDLTLVQEIIVNPSNKKIFLEKILILLLNYEKQVIASKNYRIFLQELINVVKEKINKFSSNSTYLNYSNNLKLSSLWTVLTKRHLDQNTLLNENLIFISCKKNKKTEENII